MSARSRRGILPFTGAAVLAVLAVLTLSTVSTRLTATSAIQSSRAAAQSDSADATARMIEALDLHEGSIVAEIGAGGGERTLAIARHVGPSGRVYSSELGAKHLDTLRKAVEAGGVQNVTVIEGDPVQTNLPEACCDALFMENVYHHFDDPAAMDASIFRSLKPGGRVAVLDFTPPSEAARPQDRDTDGHHGVMPETVKTELQRAGFEEVKVDAPGNRSFLVVMRKPMTSSK